MTDRMTKKRLNLIQFWGGAHIREACREIRACWIEKEAWLVKEKIIERKREKDREAMKLAEDALSIDHACIPLASHLKDVAALAAIRARLEGK